VAYGISTSTMPPKNATGQNRSAKSYHATTLNNIVLYPLHCL